VPGEPPEVGEPPDVPPVELDPEVVGVVVTDVLETFCKVVSWAARPIRPPVAAAAAAATQTVVRRTASIARSRPAAANPNAEEEFRGLDELIAPIMASISKTPVRSVLAFANPATKGATKTERRSAVRDREQAIRRRPTLSRILRVS
jgi:hypothetical protein